MNHQMKFEVGEVIAVQGIKITLKVFENSNQDTLYYEGTKYKGLSIREHVSIQRGFRYIICLIEGEYLDERKFEEDGSKTQYIRKVEAKPIGYFENDKFYEGIKFLPMIKDSAYLLPESKISEIYSQDSEQDFVIGNMLKEDIPISLSWHRIFNTHIGIFGNTGSGKSNTLAKLFTVLFENKKDSMKDKSNFILLDFNGEYTSDQLITEKHKTILKLDTRKKDGDKFPLSLTEFWNLETLSILFQATPITQRPFIKRMINGRSNFINNSESLLNYIKATIRDVFCAAYPKPDTLDLVRHISKITKNDELSEILKTINWNGTRNNFYIDSPQIYFDSDGAKYLMHIKPLVDNTNINDLDQFDELMLRANLQLTKDLLYGYVQYEHIQPLLKRVESSLYDLRKVLKMEERDPSDKLLTIISLKRCNQEMKKVLPLLIVKHFYHQHKDIVKSPINKTLHFVVDEAHNILSQKSKREAESWKDYRLELFEEIIKEGRKFGVFLTLASQRPADISPTIISQIHNFFIHRLVNDRDLFLLDNTISSLDHVSRNLIPSLSKGACVVTGTSFDLPMLLQIDILKKDKQPDSDDVNLKALWS